MKVFLDRLSDLLDLPDLLATGRRLRGKAGFVLCSSLDSDPSPVFVSAWQETFAYLGMRYGGLLHADCTGGYAPERYEGDVAFLWNTIADEHEHGRYEVVIHDGTEPWEVDFRPVMKAAVDDFLAGRSAATISARFHNTLVDVSAELVRAALTQIGDVAVVLSGGCFQNARLAEGISSALRGEHRVYRNHDIPPGDGGIALGQALVADAFARGTMRTTDHERRTTEVLSCV